MTKLKCSVCSCASNKDDYCCRPCIDVSGVGACCCSETNCSSYSEKSGGMSNSMNEYTNVNSTLDIKCTAEKCVHYDNGKCHSGLVNIVQGSNGTECASFQEKA